MVPGYYPVRRRTLTHTDQNGSDPTLHSAFFQPSKISKISKKRKPSGKPKVYKFGEKHIRW